MLLAYQFRLPFSVDVGGRIDRPLLVWVHDPEIEKSTGTRFRWTTGGSELYLRDWGAGNPSELEVRLTRWRPDNGIADLTMYVNGQEFATPQASGQGWQEYSLPIAEDKFLGSDDLDIKFETDTFIPKDQVPGSQDPRRLGIQISSIKLTPLNFERGKLRPAASLVWNANRLPPLDLSFYFIASALVLYIGLALFGIPRLYASIASILFSISTAVALVLVRPYLALFADTFLVLLVASFLLGALARLAARKFLAWGGIRPRVWDINLLSLMFAFSFLIKMGMLLYPQTISFDLLYHVHRLTGVMEGTLFWSIPSGKNEFGGQPVPYSPSFYLFLAPFTKLVPMQLLVQLSGVLLDNVSIYFIYFLVCKYFGDAGIRPPQSGDRPFASTFPGRAGLFAAWIYLIAPLAFIALSWGIYANIFGQFITLLLVVALIVAFDDLTRLGAFVVIALLFALTLLSHTSVFASVVPLFAGWAALLLVLGKMWRGKPFWALVTSIVLASIIAFTIYYSQFLGLVTEGTIQIASTAADPTTRNVSGETLNLVQLLQPARTPFTAVPLYVYAAALAGIGGLIYLAWRQPTRVRFLIVTMLIAWFAAFGLLIAVRAEFGFSSRYVNFAMPAIALCAGAALAWLYARGLIGRAISMGLSLVLTAQGLYHWYILVMFQYH